MAFKRKIQARGNLLYNAGLNKPEETVPIMFKIDQLLQQSSDKHSSNATFANPLALFRSCHDKILHFSSALQTLSATLQQEGWTEQLHISAEQIRRYFNLSGPEHHLDEEEHLFPAIIALDPELKQAATIEMVQLINRLIKEHVEADSLWEALDKMLAEQSEDFNTIEELAQQFAADMQEHITLENEKIFPFVEARINETKLKEMGTDIAKRRGVKQ